LAFYFHIYWHIFRVNLTNFVRYLLS